MNDHSETTTSGDRAVVFLRQVAELIGIDNLPAPITVAVHSRSVLVREDDLPVWCQAIGVTTPDFEPSVHNDTALFARVDVLGFELIAVHHLTQPAVA